MHIQHISRALHFLSSSQSSSTMNISLSLLGFGGRFLLEFLDDGGSFRRSNVPSTTSSCCCFFCASTAAIRADDLRGDGCVVLIVSSTAVESVCIDATLLGVPIEVPAVKNGKGGNTTSMGYGVVVVPLVVVLSVDDIVESFVAIVATAALRFACIGNGTSDGCNDGIGKRGNPSNDWDSAVADELLT